MNTTTTSVRMKAGYYLYCFALIIFGIICGGNMYQVIAEVPNWSHTPAASLVAYRQFFRVSHAGYFFQSLVPVTIVCSVVALMLLRNRPRQANRWMFGILGLMVAAEAFTIIYFLPRNFLLFLDPLNQVSESQIIAAAKEWQVANYLRLAMVLATMVSFVKVHGILSRTFQLSGVK